MIKMYNYSFTLLLIAVFIISYPGCARHPDDSGTGHTKDTLSIMSYNVQNLFDLVNNGSEYKLYIPDKDNWNYEMFNRKIDNISNVIAAANPDIVVLSEIENTNVLRKLRHKLFIKKSFYRYTATGDKPDPVNVCTAILSKLPIVNTSGHGIGKTGRYYTRNILEADIRTAGGILKIFAVHWPSKRNPEKYRIRAAEVLEKRIKELKPGCEYILAGDFNTNYNEAENIVVSGIYPPDLSVGLNHILKTVESAPGEPVDFFTEEEVISSGSFCHYDLWLELPEYKRWSYVYKGRRNTLDHILLPQSLLDSTGISYADNSFTPFYFSGRLIRDKVPFEWQKQWNKNGKIHSGYGYSDHLPIIAKFYYGPYSNNQEEEFIQLDASNNRCDGIFRFETETGGWLCRHRNFNVQTRNSSIKKNGRCLNISGKYKRNITAAAAAFSPGVFCVEPGGSLCMDIRGKGNICFRVRINKNGWLYSNPVSQELSKMASYPDCDIKEWKSYTIGLPEMIKTGDILMLEFRAGKHSDIDFYLDNIEIKE